MIIFRITQFLLFKIPLLVCIYSVNVDEIKSHNISKLFVQSLSNICLFQFKIINGLLREHDTIMLEYVLHSNNMHAQKNEFSLFIFCFTYMNHFMFNPFTEIFSTFRVNTIFIMTSWNFYGFFYVSLNLN